MDRQTLHDWVHRYNEAGLAELSDRHGGGTRPLLSPEREAELAGWVRQGPDLAKHGVVRWRRADLARAIEARFGVALAERSISDVLRRLGFRRLVTRPRHPGQNECRIGQQGTLTRVWAERGSRPAAPRHQRCEWCYLFGAICPARGTGAALVLPHANTSAMNLHLLEISTAISSGAHAVLIVDGAGWHQTGGSLRLQDTITLLHLPPYSPELNPVENVWAFLRGNKLSNRVFASYNAIVDACCKAWNGLIQQPDRITTLGTRAWAQLIA